MALPQLSAPRAGHSIIAMEMAGHLPLIGRTLLVFGGGDNEGHFYSDVTTVAVEDLLAAL